ncbi:hypothetical protein DCO58_10620 [Helicobacter saguini]|uniref:Co-chaperone DjlA N-terminal domain-containing protein n=1 Tax=Helicobacter saguini TaxID=1548018 RepID=A0A347VPR5_9HELI|nr:TerB family tellurite resistance protein [Helicobacter saguini]MWV61247.1 hypothetical protein [Helicobacter saguini]MWV68086.1 hypothetical protein [Helicobacter saguini]MWV70450.1 hypothetical protein [Helicobacter saguini]MWV72351.1 hypothetical protein [Helicobacter saguini]TLD93000.1 hypothetical protein LS64_009415 [Helicobacter saguini]
MELVLFIIAAGIIFYLYKTFQVYLSNPIAPNDRDVLQPQPRTQPRQELAPPTPKERLRNSEYGILTRILGRLSHADSNSCPLEERLVRGLIHDMSSDTDYPETLFLEIYKESGGEDIQQLANLFAAETIAQYKKRLKIVEFMFALSYADGDFSKDEEECIIDVAAILEIENDDFNKLYDEFAAINKEQKVSMDADSARKILRLESSFTKEELDKKYDELVNDKRQNIFDPKNLARPYNEFVGEDLRSLSMAYAVLLPLVSKKSINSESNETKIL